MRWSLDIGSWMPDVVSKYLKPGAGVRFYCALYKLLLRNAPTKRAFKVQRAHLKVNFWSISSWGSFSSSADSLCAFLRFGKLASSLTLFRPSHPLSTLIIGINTWVRKSVSYDSLSDNAILLLHNTRLQQCLYFHGLPTSTSKPSQSNQVCAVAAPQCCYIQTRT